MLMVDITKIQSEIVERLKSLQPERIILFGSYATGNATEDSDIDLFLVKDTDDQLRRYKLDARMQLRDLIRKYHIGFDILAASQSFLDTREDYFYKVDILTDGKVIYAK
jgi:predicted nucleotidyltransferase